MKVERVFWLSNGLSGIIHFSCACCLLFFCDWVLGSCSFNKTHFPIQLVSLEHNKRRKHYIYIIVYSNSRKQNTKIKNTFLHSHNNYFSFLIVKIFLLQNGKQFNILQHFAYFGKEYLSFFSFFFSSTV